MPKKVIDILNHKSISMSCELFPPKYGNELFEIRSVIDDIALLSPSFISVTYGAGGTKSDQTIKIARDIETVAHIPALAHLTCISSDKAKIISALDELRANGIENVLALRGDVSDNSPCTQDMHYHHASDLMREINDYGGFCIGGACYPEGHPEAETAEQDIENLKFKIQNGCQFLTTQMFFDNNILYNFMYKILKTGINVPIVAGIMPVVNAKQITRICSLSGTSLPPRFKAIVNRFADNPDAMKQAGIAFAAEQIIDLIANGVTNIHIYTMNKPEIAGSIFNSLSEIIKFETKTLTNS